MGRDWPAVADAINRRMRELDLTQFDMHRSPHLGHRKRLRDRLLLAERHRRIPPAADPRSGSAHRLGLHGAGVAVLAEREHMQIRQLTTRQRDPHRLHRPPTGHHASMCPLPDTAERRKRSNPSTCSPQGHRRDSDARATLGKVARHWCVPTPPGPPTSSPRTSWRAESGSPSARTWGISTPHRPRAAPPLGVDPGVSGHQAPRRAERSADRAPRRGLGRRAHRAGRPVGLATRAPG